MIEPNGLGMGNEALVLQSIQRWGSEDRKRRRFQQPGGVLQKGEQGSTQRRTGGGGKGKVLMVLLTGQGQDYRTNSNQRPTRQTRMWTLRIIRCQVCKRLSKCGDSLLTSSESKRNKDTGRTADSRGKNKDEGGQRILNNTGIKKGKKPVWWATNPKTRSVQRRMSQVDSLRDCPYYCSSLYT